MEAPWSSCDRVTAATAARKAAGYRMAVGRFPRASWRASDRSERIASFIVAPPRDGATMPRPGGHRPDGEPRGLTTEALIAGAAGYLHKPFNLRNLDHLVAL